MNTSDVAVKIGTTPRQLRSFLRSSYSTFVPVGSGSRYEFTDREIPTIEKRFAEWKNAGKPKSQGAKAPTPAPVNKPRPKSTRDSKVWAEEGPVELEDIRDPRVRARVRRDAQAAEDRLSQLLIARGMHILQVRNRNLSATSEGTAA